MASCLLPGEFYGHDSPGSSLLIADSGSFQAPLVPVQVTVIPSSAPSDFTVLSNITAEK